MINKTFTTYDIYCAYLVVSMLNLALLITIIIFEVVHYLQTLH